eukprot:10223793-Karenia_brevis.AAC.1
MLHGHRRFPKVNWGYACNLQLSYQSGDALPPAQPPGAYLRDPCRTFGLHTDLQLSCQSVQRLRMTESD